MPAMKMLNVVQRTSPFDLQLVLNEGARADVLTASFQYNTDLFDRATIKRMSQHFLNIMQSFSAQPLVPIPNLHMLDKEEVNTIFKKWNDTKSDFPERVCAHELFEHQASSRSDAVAIVFNGCSLTYGELNIRANVLAYYLRSRGICAGDRVGILLPRSLRWY